MEFCPDCNAILSKVTLPDGDIQFTCTCQLIIKGQPKDTLMDEGTMHTADSDQKHRVFIENAPHDPARNLVFKECPQCKLDVMTMIRVGSNENTVYICTCGYQTA